MYQGTTPTLVLTVGEEQLDGCTCYVTVKSNGRMITKSGDGLTVSGNEIAVTLTQQETLSLFPGSCEIQVRWIDSNGNAMATDIARVTVSNVLLKQVIEYQEGGNSDG